MDRAIKEYEIDKGLHLVLLDLELEKPMQFSQIMQPCAILSILLEGCIEYTKPNKLVVNDYNTLSYFNNSIAEMECMLIPDEKLKSVDVVITPDWFITAKSETYGRDLINKLAANANSPLSYDLGVQSPHLCSVAQVLMQSMHD